MKEKNMVKKGKQKSNNKKKLTKEERKIIMQNRATKAPALPIPEHKYNQFKERLIELSGSKAARNLMIFQIGVATGYRSGDIVILTIADIEDALNEGRFNILESKSIEAWKTYQENRNKPKNKDKDYYKVDRKIPRKRSCVIKENLRNILEAYIKGKRRSDYAFPATNNKNKHITVKRYSDILTQVGKSLGLKHISGHSTRKTYAHRLFQNKAENLDLVRRSLGHKSLETTQVYLGMEEAVEENAAAITDKYL